MTINPVFDQLGVSIFETMSRLAAETGAINLGQGFPEGLEPPALIEAAIEALRAGPHQYPPSLGLPVLRQAVARNARRFHGLDLDWDSQVVVTSGATEALACAFLALLDTGDEVILLEPAYDSYRPLIRRAGGVVVPVRLSPPDWRLPVGALTRAITPRTRAIVVNNPMNPIGKIFDREELADIARLAERHDLTIIADEVYDHIVFDDQPFQSLLVVPGAEDRTIRIGSAGKTFSVTGWKIGYASAAPHLAAAVAKAHQFVTFTTPPALQIAVAAGLEFPDSFFREFRADLQSRRDLLVGALRQAGFDAADVAATYFTVAPINDLNGEGDDFAFCQRLVREAGVAAVPLSSFYGDRSIRSHVRFCFAKRAETLTEAADRLALWRAGARLPADPEAEPRGEPSSSLRSGRRDEAPLDECAEGDAMADAARTCGSRAPRPTTNRPSRRPAKHTTKETARV